MLELQDYGPARFFEFSSFSPDAWDSVAPDRITPMQQHMWVSATISAIGPREDVKVLTVGTPETPKAMAPLSIDRSGPRGYRLLGAEELGESVEVIYSDDAALSALAEGLSRLRYPVSLGHYPLDTPFVERLRSNLRTRGLIVDRKLHVKAMPYVKLAGEWKQPETQLGPGRRSDYRRKRRKAEKLGKVTTEVLSPSPSEFPSLYEEAMGIETRSWKGHAGTAVSMNPFQSVFYRKYGELAARAGSLRICFLRIDGVSVAMQYLVELRNRMWQLKIGYDDRLSDCSPGFLLMRDMLSYGASQGHVGYEFLGKEAAWTRMWSATARPIGAVRVYPFNFKGARAALFDTWKHAKFMTAVVGVLRWPFVCAPALAGLAGMA
jgi:CelD/BcsL family acetyltransferase involved in cellulose biosynthesis